MLLSLLSRRSLEVDSRDSYGFTLRPQHVQLYKDYICIYKEEEEERSIKWNIFLEQMQPDQPISTEEELEETAKTEDTEAETKTGSEKNEEGCDSVNESNGSTECETRNEVQLPEESKEEERPAEQHEEEVQHPKEEVEFSDELENGVKLPEESKEEEWLSEQHEEVQHPKDPKEEVESSDEVENGAKLSKEDQDEVQLGEVLEKEGKLSEEPVKGDKQLSVETYQNNVQIVGNPENEEQVSVELEKEKQPSEETHKKHVEPAENSENEEKLLEDSEDVKVPSEEKKVKKVHSCARIRPFLGSIETMMCRRVKKANYMEENETEDDITSGSSMDSTTGDEGSFPWKEELQFLVHGGLPKDLRGEAWQAFVGVKKRRVKRFYQDLLAKEADDGGESNVPDNSSCVDKKWKRQIEKDILRTFPGHPALNENGRDSLRRILLAYAQHNPSVGYCQAMNFFAGILLLLMPEENAFWTFLGIIDDYFEGYYSEEMIESQVDQLVFEELMREKFPKLVNHLDSLGVQVAWISGPWFLSLFVNVLPWECVLRVWDVLLFEGNRVMLFRTALALMELYGPLLVTTKDAGDAITLLQSLTGSTFDSSQLVLTACMGYLFITEAKLQQLREKHRPAVLEVVEERSRRGRIWKDSKGIASKLYSFKHDHDESKATKKGDPLEPSSSNLDELLDGLGADDGIDSLPDLQEQVVWLKVELCRALQDKRTATLRAEELETALTDLVKEDNHRELNARIEELEDEVAGLKQVLADKKEQETAMLQVLMRVEHEQRVTEDTRRSAEREAAAQKYTVRIMEEKYDKAMASIAQMEKRVVMAESMLEATLSYESGQAKVVSSPWPQNPPQLGKSPSGYMDSPRRKIPLLTFGLGWRDRNKGKPNSGDEPVSTSAQKQSDLQEPQPQ